VNDSTSATSPVWPTRWPKDSFKSVWTWVLAVFVAGIFISAFVAGIKTGRIPAVSALEFDALLGLQFVLEGFLVVLILASMPSLSKFSLRELGFQPPATSAVGTALLGAIAMVIVANGGAALIDYLAHSMHQQDIVQIFQQLHDPRTTILFAAFAIVFAPFAEETFFRIFFFNLGMRYGGFWTGAVLSGVLFGIAHGDLYAALPLTLGGIILCAVYYRTRNVFAPMISHALFNAVSIVALLIAPKITS
jgi:membrane protease YdiL (CAAX protease family)